MKFAVVFEMADPRKVRITVLKRLSPSEVFCKPAEAFASAPGACTHFKDGQQFIVTESLEMPEGFCTSAWVTLFSNVELLAFGGNYPWLEEGVSINCCTDGMRPVVFKLERM